MGSFNHKSIIMQHSRPNQYLSWLIDDELVEIGSDTDVVVIFAL